MRNLRLPIILGATVILSGFVITAQAGHWHGGWGYGGWGGGIYIAPTYGTYYNPYYYPRYRTYNTYYYPRYRTHYRYYYGQPYYRGGYYYGPRYYHHRR